MSNPDRRHSATTPGQAKVAWALALTAMLWSEPASAAPELVLAPGARLEVTTASGRVAVVAGGNFERAYEWNGCILKSNMHARSSRWLGKLGIYDPAGRVFPSMPWSRCKGLSRTVVDEAQMHFADALAAQQWLARFCTYRGASRAWSSDGLVACMSIEPQREQFSMDVHQICVDGRPPTSLPGATDSAFRLTSPGAGRPAREQCVRADAATLEATRAAWQKEWDWVDAQRKREQSRGKMAK